MSAKDKTKWKRRKSCKITDDDNDCASLAWLLNFRLDEFVNVKVPDDEPVVKEAKVDDVPQTLKKPPYTYPELIEKALRENGELTVSAIYQWISDRFPFYKANDERWKNSVRHNLSINPHFRKGARAPQGAGHLWSLAANAIDLLPLRRPLVTETKTVHEETSYIGLPKVIVLDEAAIAAASIIPDQDLFNGSTKRKTDEHTINLILNGNRRPWISATTSVFESSVCGAGGKGVRPYHRGLACNL